jgi:dTDP-4-dehydrorhamnose reductase
MIVKFNNNTKIYIAGCGGMLGLAVYELFSQAGVVKATDIDVNEPWLEYADVRDYGGIAKSIRQFMPDLVINLAANTDMEKCEREQENAWLTNALGAENTALIAEELGVPYIYISTAGIFGGDKEFYHDYDEPNPLSMYAKSKYAGELFTRQCVRKHYVVRAGWMMGGGPRKDKKFINKIYRQIAAGATELNVVDDKLGTPTYTHDFAHGLLRLAENDLYGVYNQVCGGSCSRFDVAVEFVRLLGLAEKVKINKVSSDFFQQEYFAPRPHSEKLITMKLDARGLNVMRDWKTCLQEYAKEFEKDLNQLNHSSQARKSHQAVGE